MQKVHDIVERIRAAFVRRGIAARDEYGDPYPLCGESERYRPFWLWYGQERAEKIFEIHSIVDPHALGCEIYERGDWLCCEGCVER